MQNINDLYKENSINICISTFPLCFMRYILTYNPCMGQASTGENCDNGSF